MINLFTYLSFTEISMNQLYQQLIIFILAVIILYSTYFSLKKVPTAESIKNSFYSIFTGFITIILNIGLFFVFLYLVKTNLMLQAIWFSLFSIIIHIINVLAYSIISTTILTPKYSRKKIKQIILFLCLFFISAIILSLIFFDLNSTAKFFYQYFVQKNYLNLGFNMFSCVLVLVFLIIKKFKVNQFLLIGILAIQTSLILHSTAILKPFTLKYTMPTYNILTIIGFIAIEIFVFFQIIKELNDAKNDIINLNTDLEEKIKDRTQELYKSNKELFESNYMLHQEKEKLNSILENMEEGIIVSSINNKILMINSSAKYLLNIKDIAVGLSISDVIPSKNYTYAINNIILKKTTKASREITIHDDNFKNTVRNIQIKSSLSIDSKGNVIGIITLIRDISKEIEIEKVKSNFSKAISQELKNPLTTIIGFVDTLCSERIGKLNIEQKKILNIIMKESSNLHQLINNFLEFSRLTADSLSLTLEEVNIRSIIANVLDSFTPLAETNNIKIDVNDKINVPMIQADKDKIQKIYENLIGNSLRFIKDSKILINFIVKPEKIITKITDTVTVWSDSTDIFDTFSQINKIENNTQYTSVLDPSLPIAKKLVQLHDGKIWAEKEDPQGRTFYIELKINL